MKKPDIIIKNKIIDNGTGEVITEKDAAVKNRFDADRGYLFRTTKAPASISCYVGNFPKNLTDADTGKLIKLSAMLLPDVNCLVYRSGNITKPLRIEHAAKILQISQRQAQRFISKLIAEQVMAKVYIKRLNSAGDDFVFREIRYFINPAVVIAGNWINRDLYFLFKQELDKILPPWVIKKFN